MRSLLSKATSLLLAVCLLAGSFAVHADEPAIPTLTQRVTDQTGTLTTSQQQQLETALASFETKTGSQIAVLIVSTTGDDSIEQYAVRTFEQWKLGRKDVDDGVLLLVAKDDRTLRIEVGYGLEGTITDLQAGQIINRQIVPQFANGDYYAGIAAGVSGLMELIDPSPAGESATDSYTDGYGIGSTASSTSSSSQAFDRGNPFDIGLLVWGAILLLVPLVGRLLPINWMKQRSVGRYIVCCLAVGAIAVLYNLVKSFSMDQAIESSLGIFGGTLGIYFFFLMPVSVIKVVLAALLRGGGGGGGRGGGGFGGGGGGFGGGGGRSGGGGASGRW